VIGSSSTIRPIDDGTRKPNIMPERTAPKMTPV